MIKNLPWNEAQQQISHPGVYLLIFKTTWCPDCKMMKLLIEDLIKDLTKEGIVNYQVIEVDAEAADLFRKDEQWSVQKVPSFYLIHNQTSTHLGYEFVPIEKIRTSLVDAINAN